MENDARKTRDKTNGIQSKAKNIDEVNYISPEIENEKKK